MFLKWLHILRWFSINRSISSGGLCICLIMGCPESGPAEVPLETSVSYFGFADGQILTFSRSDGSEEKWSFKKVSEDAETKRFFVESKQGGFPVLARTMTFEVTESALWLTGRYDCLSQCITYSPSVLVMERPALTGGRAEGETEALEREASGDETTRSEKHVFQIGDEVEKSVGDEKYEGWEVVWTQTVNEQSEAIHWTFLPEVGMAEWETPDGLLLTLVGVE